MKHFKKILNKGIGYGEIGNQEKKEDLQSSDEEDVEKAIKKLIEQQIS